MYFIGYHGTSEASAVNILTVGVQERFLPPTGQIGRGFYVAKMNGALPKWGAEQATAPARARQPRFTQMISLLTGEAKNPWLDNSAKRAILKIYSTRPLLRCNWNIMNSGDFAVLKAVLYGDGGPGLDVLADAQWLQMVIPPEEIQYLRARRDDGVFEMPQNWRSKESHI
ncbi:hypothetical protein [Bordetella petrii]|uniref:hypothetical protein n=1 Tax=Bordetella petrii TaxID=94624 RepID=UPI001E3C4AF6|nr:hypothetical protein [Bordetella petrii]MCD0502121.1 hypothetical protein [Bordetella petrii]